MQVDAQLALNDGVVDAGGTVDEVEWRVETFVGQTHLGEVRAFVGDPAGVDGGHEDAVVEHFLGAGAGQHVQCCLGHVGVRVARALVCAAELAFHGGDVHDVLASRSGRSHRWAQA